MVIRQRGFSLVELIVVVAIMGILLGVAAPSFSEWVASQLVRDTAADLHSSLTRARSEAISRGLATTVTAVSGNLANGWYIANPDSGFNPDAANPTIFVEQHGAVNNATISGATNVTFTNIGHLSGSAIGIKIAVSGTSQTRCVTVDTAGRPKTRVINASDSCS